MRNTIKIKYRKDSIYADGTSPVYLQAYIQGKRVLIPLKFTVDPLFFDKKNQIIKKKYPNSDTLNILIAQAKQKAQSIILNTEIYGGNLTKATFEAAYNETITNNKSIIDFIKKELENSIDTPNTVKSHRSMFNHLIVFKKEITFGEVNYELIENFDKYLRKKKLGDNTIHKYHKTLSAFINKAINKSIKIENPYNKFKIKSVESEIEYLNFDELLLLMNLYDSGNLAANLHHVLRYYLFSCTCNGIRFSDVSRLTDENVSNNEIVFTPQKTKRFRNFIRLPLTKMGEKYIQDAKNDPLIKKRVSIFNCITNQKTNEYLKEIALYAGIKPISFHSSRHTFATLFLTKSNDVATLQKLLGHAKMEQTMMYVHISQQQKIRELAKFDEMFE
jgi:integrase/recombinase XerD